MDKEIFILNITNACKKHGEPVTVAFDKAGVGKNLLANIRRGSMPSVEKVADLAAYLGVSSSELIGDSDVPQQPSILDGLTPQQFARVRDFVAGMKAGE